MTPRAALAALAVAVAGCHETHTVILTVAGSERMQLPVGFTCFDANRQLLTERVMGRPLCLVVDFIDLGDVRLTCQPFALRAYCTDAEAPLCTVKPSFRQVIEVPVPTVPNIAAALGAFPPFPTPDGTVQARVTALAGRCSQVVPADAAAPFAEDTLVGCISSCPEQFDEVDGKVFLELPVPGRLCTIDQVVDCAKPDLDPNAT